LIDLSLYYQEDKTGIPHAIERSGIFTFTSPSIHLWQALARSSIRTAHYGQPQNQGDKHEARDVLAN
jgi:hypothetical protein